MIKKNGKLIESLIDALELPHAPVVSVVGAGGKTTVITNLSKEYMRRNIPHIITTTTHMWCPKGVCFLEEECLNELDASLEAYKAVWIGKKTGEKFTGVSQSALEEICKKGVPILIESDGAKEYPLKVPNKQEPVIIGCTTNVIGVIGLDAIGREMKDVCFRMDEAKDFLQIKETDHIRLEHIVKIATDKRGLKKNVEQHMQFSLVLNKCDTTKERVWAEGIEKHLKKIGIDSIIFMSNKGGENNGE